jgi:hypothetical protein
LCDEKTASLIKASDTCLFHFHCIKCFTTLSDPDGYQPTMPDQLENEVLLPPRWDATDFEWEADSEDAAESALDG